MGDIKIYLYNEYGSKYILNFQKDEIETLNFTKIKEIFQKNFCINLNDYSFSYKKDINSPFDENNIEKLIEQGIIFKSKNNIIEYGKQIDNLKKEINELQNELKYINKKKHDEIIKLSALKYEKDNWEKKVKNNIDNAVKEQIKLDKITNELVTINELKNEEQKKYDEIKKNISEKSNIYEQLEKVIEEKTEITRILDDNVIENNFKLNQYDEKKKNLKKK
jgi:chromosome segregation ATPase